MNGNTINTINQSRGYQSIKAWIKNPFGFSIMKDFYNIFSNLISLSIGP